MRMFKLALRTVLSLAMSAFFIWLSLRHTDVRAVLAAMSAADPLRIAVYVVVLLVIHLIRTVRWGILLEPLGHVGFKRLNSASAVGFMLLMLLNPTALAELTRWKETCPSGSSRIHQRSVRTRWMQRRMPR